MIFMGHNMEEVVDSSLSRVSVFDKVLFRQGVVSCVCVCVSLFLHFELSVSVCVQRVSSVVYVLCVVLDRNLPLAKFRLCYSFLSL